MYAPLSSPCAYAHLAIANEPAALVGVDIQASFLRSTGGGKVLGALDIQSAVAAYGRALGGTGILPLVRAFVPVGVFGTTVRRR